MKHLANAKKPISRPCTDRVPLTNAPPIVHEVLSSPGRPLEPAVRADMEPRFGHDFSKVRVHAGARAMESSQMVNALAFTVGTQVVFGRQQYVPGIERGRQLLAHELAHVTQAKESAADTWLRRFPVSAALRIEYKKAEAANKHYAGPDSLGWQNKLTQVANDKCRAWADLWNAGRYDQFADQVAHYQTENLLGSDGILGPGTWARIAGYGEAMAGIETVLWSKSKDVCTKAAEERIKRGYKLVTGKNLELPDDKNKSTFSAILESIPSRMIDIDEQYRGTGPAGALVYAGLGAFVPEAEIWAGKLRPGAVIQAWGHNEAFTTLKAGEIEEHGKKRRINDGDANFYGTAFVFVRYDTENSEQILVRHFGSTIWRQKSQFDIWIGANVTENRKVNIGVNR